MCVTVPAKDEAEYMEQALDALRLQYHPDGTRLNRRWYEVTVLANNCTDDTAAVVARYADRYPGFALHVVEVVFPPEKACVGFARKMLMDHAYMRLAGIGLEDRGIIVSADADTLVDRHWVHYMLAEIAGGARAVSGCIETVVGTREQTGDYLEMHRLDMEYYQLSSCLEAMLDPNPADPWPRHFHHYGPSIAVRADAYRECGGIPPVRCLEDIALYEALEAIDVTMRHSPLVKVYTSDRRSDRVEGVAFSHHLDYLADLKRRGEMRKDMGLERSLQLLRWRVALRRAHREGGEPLGEELLKLVDYLNLTEQELLDKIAATKYFGALYQDLRHACYDTEGWKDTDMDVAVRELRSYTADFLTANPLVAPSSPAGTAPDGVILAL